MNDNNSRYSEIRSSQDGQWVLVKVDDRYYILRTNGRDGHLVQTERGHFLQTLYPELAERMFEEYEYFGLDAVSEPTAVNIHSFLIDNLGSILDITKTQFDSDDWIADCLDDTEWAEIIGEKNYGRKEMASWLTKCTSMQLGAVKYIATEYNSISIAFVLANAIESLSKYERFKTIRALAEFVSEKMDIGFVMVNHDFRLFEMYYGIHVDEEGPIIHPNAEVGKEDGIVDQSVSIESLVGRNFYLYSDGTIKNRQPFIINLPDLELDIEKEESNIHEEETELVSLLPGDYWVKRIRFNDEEEQNYVIALQLDKDSVIKELVVLLETVTRMGGGFFVIPGMDMEEQRSFFTLDIIPDTVMAELDHLISSRSLPNEFSFKEKKLPKTMIEEGGNGGSETEYTYALQSPYRSAYTHMTVYTDEDGTIEDFSYSSYYSSGSAWGDMFSRPQMVSDRKDEAIEMMLYIIDRYTDAEYKKLF